jgi:hypothetical protein
MLYQQILMATLFICSAIASPTPKQHDASTAAHGNTDRYLWACPDDKPDLQAGLCYKKCDSGYKAAGPLCSKGAKNYGRGAGVPQTFVENPYVQQGGGF